MKRSQWFVLSITFWIIMSLFIYLDLAWNLTCTNSYSILEEKPATAMDISACVKAEIYAPFIWLSFILANVFSLCGFLEPKMRKK